MNIKPEESILALCARLHLASQLDLQENELEYIGATKIPGGRLEMFNITREGHPLHHSTRSVAIRDDCEDPRGGE